jgi:hypothetical protein
MQGQFSLTTNQFQEFSALNAKLREGGFTESIFFRQTSGNISLAEYSEKNSTGDLIRARNITLVADNGNIDIAGTLDASGPRGGNIYVYAAQPTADAGKGNIFIRSTATLDATSVILLIHSLQIELYYH